MGIFNDFGKATKLRQKIKSKSQGMSPQGTKANVKTNINKAVRSRDERLNLRKKRSQASQRAEQRERAKSTRLAKKTARRIWHKLV